MLASQVPQILAAVFECTLEMINKDMEVSSFVFYDLHLSFLQRLFFPLDRILISGFLIFQAFPEHRTNFFQLIHALTVECFPVFLALPQEQLSYIIDAVVWAFQHSMRNVAEIGEGSFL